MTEPNPLMQDSDLFRKGAPVRRGRTIGHTTGTTRPCRKGCTGPLIGIRWPKKKGQRSRITWHCSNTLTLDRIHFRF